MTKDIAEYKKAEELRKESEERYKALVENAPEALVVFDVESRKFVSVSESAVKLFKMPKEELLEKGPLQLSPEYQPDGRLSTESGLEKIGEAIAGGKPSFEWTHCDKEGNTIPCEVWLVRLPSESQVLIRGSIIDISIRKKAELALKESEEKYRSLVEQAVDAIALYDTQGKILDVNTGSINLLGYAKEELMQMHLRDILTAEELRTKPIQYDVLQNGDSTVKQRMMRKKDGSVVQTEVRSQQLPDGRFLSVIRDLTERVKAQEQIKKEKELSDSIINSLPGLFYLIDESGKYIRWNKLKEEISGYTSDEMSRMNSFDFFDGEEKELVRQRIKAGFANGTTEVEAHLITKNGKRILFYFTGIAIEYEGKKCMVGTGIDISDRKEAEQELEGSYKAIRKLTDHLQNIREEERTHIAREIHDELGQQLTVLKMDIAWINKKIGTKDEPLKARIKELLVMLDQTVKSVRRISSELRPSLLDDLGLTAAMEWQLTEFEKRFDIKTYFDSLQAEIKMPEITKTGLFRIFQESLTNVARHSKAKKVRVTMNRKNSSLILSVADDGVGFDKESAVGKRTFGILGMRERTAMIGGTYDIISGPGKGTEVVVTIPLINEN